MVSRGELVYTTISGLNGAYNQAVLSGTYTLTASASGYLPRTLTDIRLPAGLTTTVPITLTPALTTLFPIISR